MTKSTMQIGGLPVVDAKKPIELHVTQKDIDNGVRNDPRKCAGAVAIKRDIPGVAQVAVHSERIYILRENAKQWERFRTPKRLHEELVAFDRGGKMDPFECQLGVLTQSRRTGKRQGGSTDKAPRRKIARTRRQHFITNIRERGANR